MDFSPTFSRPLVHYPRVKFKTKYWQKALDAFNTHNYLAVFQNIIYYINPSKVVTQKQDSVTKYTIHHGLIELRITISPNNFTIEIPFLKSEKPAIGLLREAAKVNLYPLIIGQIYLEKDQLFFRYSDDIELCTPIKIYKILEQMTLEADYKVASYAKDFSASLLVPPQVKNISTRTIKQGWEIFQNYLTEASQYEKFFESKHREYSTWLTINILLKKIDFTLQPQGVLRFEIEEGMKLLARDIPDHQKVQHAKEIWEKFKAINYDQFTASMYTLHVFIPNRFSTGFRTVYDIVKKDYEYVVSANAEASYTALFLTNSLLKLPYNYLLPPAFEKMIIVALSRSSGKTWEKSKEALSATMRYIINMRDYPQSFFDSLIPFYRFT